LTEKGWYSTIIAEVVRVLNGWITQGKESVGEADPLKEEFLRVVA